MWAAEWLLGPDGDVLRQPAMVPILDGVPYGCRSYIVSRYCQVVRDLSWAVQENARTQTDASHKRLVGAWVVLLRVFPWQCATTRVGVGSGRVARALGRGGVGRGQLHSGA